MKKDGMSSAVAVICFLMTGAASAAEGQKIYTQNCAICHNNLEPKLGDKAVWRPLIAKGDDALVASVIHGKGKMPPRAGKAALSDEDIEAAVEYLVSKSK